MRNAARMTCVAILIALLQAGCASGSGGSDSDFSKKVDQLRPGTSKTEVVQRLGKPDRREPAVSGAQPTGPQPPVVVPAGQRYEHWLYRRGDTDYHLFLGQTADHPGHWSVLSTSANPTQKP